MLIGKPMTVKASTVYEVECYERYVRSKTGKILRDRKTPKLKWFERFNNQVTTVGLNQLLDATIKTGVSSPTWYVGLKGTGSLVLGDTSASHSGWTEDANYSESTRQAFTPGSIASGSVNNSASKAVFSINGTTTIYGCFLINNSTKSGTTGILYGGGDFGSSRAVISGDVLNVTVTLTQSN